MFSLVQYYWLSKGFFLTFKDETQSAVYKESVRTEQQTLSTTVIKASQLMMYKAKVAVRSDIRIKHSSQSERHVEFLNVKPCGTERNR